MIHANGWTRRTLHLAPMDGLPGEDVIFLERLDAWGRELRVDYYPLSVTVEVSAFDLDEGRGIWVRTIDEAARVARIAHYVMTPRE